VTMRWVTQLNVRLDKSTDDELGKEAELAGSTRSQIAREAIKKELERRKRARVLERSLEVVGT
jgi:predicted transcriptional regulator